MTLTTEPSVASTRPRPRDGRTSLPRCREATFGEDQHEGREAERQGEVGVGEVDARAGAAEQQTETQVGEQRRQPGRDGQPDGEDRRDEDGGPDQEKDVELVDVHASSSRSPEPDPIGRLRADPPSPGASPPAAGVPRWATWRS